MVLRHRDPAPDSEALHRAGLKFLDLLDDVRPRDLEEAERAVHRALRRAAFGTSFQPADVWRKAGEIERDPLEKLRWVLGDDWEPSLL